jgi:hypothetical protein
MQFKFIIIIIIIYNNVIYRSIQIRIKCQFFFINESLGPSNMDLVQRWNLLILVNFNKILYLFLFVIIIKFIFY